MKMTAKNRRLFCILLAAAVIVLACAAASASGKPAPAAPQADAPGLYAPELKNEYLVGGAAWQQSAEARALTEQTFRAASANVLACMDKCLDPDEPDWEYDADANAMYYRGKRAAVVTDIDDTLINGAPLNARMIETSSGYINAVFARYILDSAAATPGAVDFVKLCGENGVEVFYITNRSDLGVAFDKAGSAGEYKAVAGDAPGTYLGPDGKALGASIYECLGKSFYDITLESMGKLGFPIDDRHLILNDIQLNGSSKEPARQAVVQGAADYPTGQRQGENTTDTALSVSLEPHHVLMYLGDDLADLTDVFSAPGLDARSRAALMEQYADRFGTEWIVLPNAMYGDSFNYAREYGLAELLQDCAWVPPAA